MQKFKVLMSAATIVGLSGLAAACPPECEEDCCEEGEEQAHAEVWYGEMAEGEHGKKVIEKWIGDDGDVHLLHTDGDDENVEIMVFSDGKTVKVMRNGKEMPAEWLKKSGHLFKFRGDHEAGDTIDLQFAPATDGNLSFGTAWTADSGDEDEDFFVEKVQTPPVMLGITMGEPDASLRAHLGLGDRSVIMVDSVFEGLPASNAGLKTYDIIIGLDGSDDNVNSEHLYKILMGKKPGDELKLRVLRGGEKETYRVKLRAYDAKSLGIESDGGIFVEDDNQFHADHADHSNHGEHAQHLAEMAEKLLESGMDPEQIRNIQEQVERAMKQAGQASQAIATSPRARNLQLPQFTTRTVVPGPDGREMFEIEVPDLGKFQVPDAIRGRISQFGNMDSGDLERRLDALEARMDEVTVRMEERLERVIHRFEQLTEQLERRLRDGG